MFSASRIMSKYIFDLARGDIARRVRRTNGFSKLRACTRL